MRFVVLGTSDFAIECARGLVEGGGELAAMVSMPAHALPDNSADVGRFAESAGAAYTEIEDVNTPEACDTLRAYRPDYLFVSWPRILKPPALEVPARFCIGTHPTSLPYNRGRHPLHWLIVLGFDETDLTFFRLDSAVDSGPILLTRRVGIEPEDDIGTLGRKVNAAGREGAVELCRALGSDSGLLDRPQPGGGANYWRRRTPDDVTLDFRMSTAAIVRTVRSYGPPYPCAIVRYRGGELRVAGARPLRRAALDVSDEALRRMEPGRILSASGAELVVKTDDGVVSLSTQDLVPPELETTRYLYPPTRYA